MKTLIHRLVVASVLVAGCGTDGPVMTAYVGASLVDGTGRVISDAVVVESAGHIVSRPS